MQYSSYRRPNTETVHGDERDGNGTQADATAGRCRTSADEPGSEGAALPVTWGAAPGRGATLTPVGRRLVAAARALLVRGGFAALTVEAVAAEAGTYRDAVRYHFGSKAGLVAAVVDALAHDESLAAAEGTRELPDAAERVHALVDGDRRLVDDRDAFRDFFALLPHVLLDEELRLRVAALYDWYRDLSAAGMAGPGVEPSGAAAEARLRDLASLMIAVTDGLAVQHLLEPDPARLERLFRLWEELLRRAGSTD
jgi:AcrR family transcriptional regulator